MNRSILTIALLLILLSGCGFGHIIHWDYIPNVGWRTEHNYLCNLDCFDEEGNVLPACQSCYDKNKRVIKGCIPGYYGKAEAACKSYYWNNEKKRAACVANWPADRKCTEDQAANCYGTMKENQ